MKEPLENMMQMVILSSRILEGVRRMDNILRQPEPDQKGSGIPTAFDVEFSQCGVCLYQRHPGGGSMSLSVSPKER